MFLGPGLKEVQEPKEFWLALLLKEAVWSSFGIVDLSWHTVGFEGSAVTRRLLRSHSPQLG